MMNFYWNKRKNELDKNANQQKKLIYGFKKKI